MRLVASLALVLAAPVALVSLAHCSIVSDLDSLGNGPPDAAIDASSPAPLVDSGGATVDDSSSSADAGVDAGEHDASEEGSPPLVDSGPDAPDAAPPHASPVYADAGAATWCTGQTSATFCADFDEGPLPAGFPSSDGSYLSLTSSNPSSAPNDLLLWVPAQSGSSTFASKLTRNFTEHASNVTAVFDLDPEVLNTTTSGVLFFAFDFTGSAAAKYSLRLAFNNGAARLEESFLGAGSDVYHPAFNLPTATWSHMKLVLALDDDGGASTASVYVNDVIQGQTETLSPPAGYDDRPALLVGAVYGTQPHTGWVLRYDNVAVTIR